MRRRDLVSVSILILLTVGIASPLSAGGKFSGISCRPQVNADWSKISYNRAWGVQNNAATPVTVLCPVTRDFTNPGGQADFRLTVYDRNTSSNVECTLFRLDNAGNVMSTVGASSSGGGPGTSAQVISGSYDLTGVYTVLISCVIPPAEQGWVSHVTSYSSL